MYLIPIKLGVLHTNLNPLKSEFNGVIPSIFWISLFPCLNKFDIFLIYLAKTS